MSPPRLSTSKESLGPIIEKATSLRGGECSLCTNYFEQGEDVVEFFQCKDCHFHWECLEEWFPFPYHRYEVTEPHTWACPGCISREPNHPTPEDEMASNLANHTAFVRGQDAIVEVDNIISEWQVTNIWPRDSMSAENISHMSRSRFRDDDIPEDVLERFDRIHRAAQADWDRLLNRYITAIRSVLQPRVDSLLQRFAALCERHPALRGLHLAEEECRDLLEAEMIDQSSWRGTSGWCGTRKVFDDADLIEEALEYREEQQNGLEADWPELLR